jgi:hypothetical protein
VNTIETDRLLLRPLRMDDADAAHTWFGEHIEVKYCRLKLISPFRGPWIGWPAMKDINSCPPELWP